MSIYLIIGDSDYRSLLRDFFEFKGFSCHAFANGKDVISSFSEQNLPNPELIVVDIQMSFVRETEFFMLLKTLWAKVPKIQLAGLPLNILGRRRRGRLSDDDLVEFIPGLVTVGPFSGDSFTLKDIEAILNEVTLRFDASTA